MTVPIALVAGLYAIEFIGWEQGGAFVNELSWGAKFPFSVPDSQVFFTDIPGNVAVPDGGSTAAFLGGAAAVLAVLARRRLDGSLTGGGGETTGL